MTDFKRKPGQISGGQISGGTGSQGDPLLELTQLFGMRSSPTQEGAAGGVQESQTPPEREIAEEAQPPRNGWSPGMTTQPAGISMTGSIMVGAYGTPGQISSIVSAPVPEPAVDLAPQGAAMDDAVMPQGEEDWEYPVWGDMPAMGEDENEASFQENPSHDDYVGEQLFHALEGDLTEGVAADGAEIAPSPSQHVPQNAVQQNASTSSAFSDGYFGYGQSVQLNIAPVNVSPVNVSAGANKILTPVKAAPLEPTAPPHTLADRQAPSTPPAPPSQGPSKPLAESLAEPPDFLSDFYSAETSTQDFAEALHDFDLTISQERRRRSRRNPIITKVEKTENFDLPPLDHDTGPPPPSDHDFADDFAVTVKAQSVAGENHSLAGSMPGNEQDRPLQEPSPLVATEESALHASNQGLYDWNRAAQASQNMPSTGKKRTKIYALLTMVLLVGVAGAGYWAYDFYQTNSRQAVLIRADSTSFKIAPEINADNQLNTEDIAVYNQDGSDASLGSQSELLDGSETPLDVDLLNISPDDGQNRAASSANSDDASSVDRTSLDPVDASILAAIERALPVHIVPTVTIQRDRDGNLANTPPADDRTEVVVPAGEYQTYITQQLAQGANHGSSDGDGSNGEDTEDASLREQVLEQQNEPMQEIAPSSSASPLDEEMPAQTYEAGSDLTPSQEPSPVENSATNPLFSNIPAVIPDKPVVTASRPGVNGAAPSAGQGQQQQGGQQQEGVGQANRLTGAIVDERFYVQVSSQASQQAAIESAEEVKQRFASLVGGNQIVIVPANIPGRGIYYRVRILVPNRSDAVQLCERYQAAGGNCFIGR